MIICDYLDSGIEVTYPYSGSLRLLGIIRDC